MPFQNPDSGGLEQNPLRVGFVSTRVVSEQTSVGGVISNGPDAGQPLVQEHLVPVAEAIEIASTPTSIIPPATAPAIGNLPANARPGEFFTFASQPNYMYVMCPDNVWRALPLFPAG